MLLDEIIDAYRRQHGLRKSSMVALRLGVSRSSMSQYLNGKDRMSHKAMGLLAEGAGVSIGDMLCVVNLALATTSKADREFWLKRITDSDLRASAETEGQQHESPGNAGTGPDVLSPPSKESMLPGIL